MTNKKQTEDVKYFMLAQDLPKDPERYHFAVVFNDGTTRVIIQGLYDKKKVFEFSDKLGSHHNTLEWNKLLKLIEDYEQQPTNTMQ